MNRSSRTNTEIKQYLMSIIGNSPFGIIAIGFSGEITIINKTALDYLSLSGKINNYLNKDVTELLHGIPEFNQEIEKCINTGRKSFDLHEIEYKSKFLDIKARVVLNGMLITIQDITEIKSAQRVLEEKTRLLEISNKELEQFAFISSHDLQEPLMTVISFSNLLIESSSNIFNSDEKKYLEYILESANRMSLQIKGLLEYSRLGKSKEKKLVNCNVIIEEVRQSLTTLLQNNNVKLEVQDLPHLPVYKEELNSLFQNLISNAIKFGKDNGFKRVKISAVEENNHWKFSVQDNGIGIADGNKSEIFTIFKRLHNREKYNGTGIGLAHCKKIVEMHKGDIWVESEIDKGSTFCFTIEK